MNHLRLLNDIDELEKNGVATRAYPEVGSLLQDCDGCDRYSEDGCILIGREEFVRRLTTQGEEVCQRRRHNSQIGG